MPEADTGAPTQPGESRRRPEDVTVLIVDDEVDVANYFASVLAEAGINVVTANDGEEAIEVLHRQVPDLISLDLVMPRKSGIRVLMELRKNPTWKRIPVIIVTAHARDPEIQRNLDEVLADTTMVGPSLYLDKPVTPHSYLRNICAVLDVEMAVEGIQDGDSSEALRDEARELLDSADADTLAAVLGQLRKEDLNNNEGC
jgi:CheY-like chemotaxis protein